MEAQAAHKWLDEQEIEDGSLLLEGVMKLVQERDALLTELKYMKGILEDVAAQRTKYAGLVDDATMALKALVHTVVLSDPDKQRLSMSRSAPSSEPTWLFEIWLTDPTQKSSCLKEVEEEWYQCNYQRAIALVSTLLKRPNLPEGMAIRAKLLRSAILRHCDDPTGALANAEDALHDAVQLRGHAMVGPCQTYRGLCLNSLQRYAEASWCFTLAAGTRPYEAKIKEWKRQAEEARVALPDGHPQKYLPENFVHVPPSREQESSVDCGK
ncbi:MAG: hypothetical protein M1832_005377 [Thelocarpon impressellum]|nr:MAG: hypothetical protein M1832_005377 [Thelocarpon impressellum]